METILLKSTLLLALLLLPYELFLRREKLHLFNRFYLLAAIAIALTAPFVSFSTYHSIVPTVDRIPVFQGMDQATFVTIANSNRYAENSSRIFDWHLILVTLYYVVAFVMLFRFTRNISHILRIARKNQKLESRGATLVLLSDNITPYSFFCYLFVSKQHFNSGKMEPELLSHEMAHIRQQHSLDIVLVELVKVVLWFNPIIYRYGKLIRMNHEFLADEYVVGQHKDAVKYQQLLLDTIFRKNTPSLVSNIGFSLTKNRLTMITKKTSAIRRMALSFFAIAIVVFACYSFCTTAKALAINEGSTSKPKGQQQAAKKVQLKFVPPQIIQDSVNVKFVPPAILKDSVTEKIKTAQPFMLKADWVTTVHGVNQLSGNIKFSMGGVKDLMPIVEFPREKLVTLKENWIKRNASKVPSQGELSKWQKSKAYEIWVDGTYYSDNTVLSTYKPSDFKYFKVSKGGKKSISKRASVVKLITAGVYEECSKATLQTFDDAIEGVKTDKQEIYMF